MRCASAYWDCAFNALVLLSWIGTLMWIFGHG